MSEVKMALVPLVLFVVAFLLPFTPWSHLWLYFDLFGCGWLANNIVRSLFPVKAKIPLMRRPF